ncbi:chemotaxis protein CheX [Effusibacillus lacus]|uniref:Chemotaxis protein CheX n=1 Tax=Effusibacillus lacus TaxID=1348429 RepID=A0A292YRR7_9BACL|nr:chemotaxis protein CheX [Effusibacillus lacus]TCS70057.1 chemotaxis protein CheX [Effusibacillus lacus]GAX91104.1 chemotaxis protein CheX [Effusibacillus lacus]
MAARIISPFMQSAASILEQMTRVQAEPGTVVASHPELHASYLWILIDLHGAVQASVAFGFVPDTALKIASAMMGGFQLNELDAISQSAISELGNMISGNACSLLSQEGLVVDISPPKLVFGQNVTTASTSAVAVPLSLREMGVMELKLLIA